MNSAIIVILLSAVCFITEATYVSEAVHKELTADVATRAKAMQMPEEQVKCIVREASKFSPTVFADGVKKYNLVAYRTHVTYALKKCHSSQDDVSIGRVMRVYRKKRALCSFCCVTFGLGGADLCFKKFCPIAFCAGKVVCH